MSSNTISPSIDQAALLTFRENFWELAQQSKSRLGGSKAVMYLPSQGKSNNMSRIGRIELTRVDSRNPKKQFTNYNLDNRHFSKYRVTATVQIDEKQDINELIADPTSSLLSALIAAKEREIDRAIANAAVGSVYVGAPDESPTEVSAATDGVVTITATGGLDYADITTITQNFINNDLEMEDFRGAIIALTGKENSDLMAITQFTNNDYIGAKPVDESMQNKLGMYGVVLFAGSVNGGITVTNPVLPEGTTTRSCLVLAPDAIAVSMELARLDVEKSADRVNSKDVTIDLWINAMRTEGVRTQIVTTTI
jgi:hypothetical protein